MYGFDKIKAALCTYKSLHGNLLVSDMFVVPKSNSDWDPSLWGMKLGESMESIWRKRKAEVVRDKESELSTEIESM